MLSLAGGIFCLKRETNPKSGGADFEEGKRQHKNMVLAESLPGKVAPVTAGEIIAETILNFEKKAEAQE